MFAESSLENGRSPESRPGGGIESTDADKKKANLSEVDDDGNKDSCN